jgi:hypothetical protein
MSGETVPAAPSDGAAADGGGASSVFSAEELSTINLLRERLQDMRGDSMADDFLNDDSVMWRYYTAHADGKCPGPADKVEAALQSAELMFRRSVAWRHRVKIDDMWKRWTAEKDTTKCDPFVQLGRYSFYGQAFVAPYSKTPSGGPLCFERVGKVDLAGLSGDAQVREALREAYIISLEAMWRAARACGGRTRGVMAVDLHGLGWNFLPHVQIIKELFKIGPPHYPEIVETVLVVRAPWIIQAAFKMLAPLLPKRTSDKVRQCAATGRWRVFLCQYCAAKVNVVAPRRPPAVVILAAVLTCCYRCRRACLRSGQGAIRKQVDGGAARRHRFGGRFYLARLSGRRKIRGGCAHSPFLLGGTRTCTWYHRCFGS